MSVPAVLEEDSSGAADAGGVITLEMGVVADRSCLIARPCGEQLPGLAPRHAGSLQTAAPVCHPAKDVRSENNRWRAVRFNLKHEGPRESGFPFFTRVYFGANPSDRFQNRIHSKQFRRGPF